MWTRLGQPADFTVREYGAGTGALGQQIREGLQRDGSALAASLRYEPIETAGRSGSALSPEPMIGMILGNEFLDALPVHRVINDGGRLRELYVDWTDGHFVEL